MTTVLKFLGYIQPSEIPVSELLRFILFANFSIVGMNVSLMWNSVGFYQVSYGTVAFLLSSSSSLLLLFVSFLTCYFSSNLDFRLQS